MERKESEKHLKKLTTLISKSSQKFIAAFLDDSIKDKKENEFIIKKVHQAIVEKNIVVLQLKKIDTKTVHETLSGWIYKFNPQSNSIMMKLQTDQQYRIISIDDIRKISLLPIKTQHRA